MSALEETQPIVVRPHPRETLSPFLVWTEADRRPIAEELDAREGAFVVDLLQDSERIAERLADPVRRQGAIVGAAGVIACAMPAFALVVGNALTVQNLPALAAVATANTLLALAAALGPTWGASVLFAARLPLARLVAILLCSAATGALVLGGLAPVVHVAWRLDPMWYGPGALFAAMLLAACVAGSRVYRLMLASAALASGGELEPGDRARVVRVAEWALLMIAFTSSLSLWAFDVFLRW